MYTSKSYIKEAVKGSLKRLGIDRIDLYQLHGGTINGVSRRNDERH